MMWWRCNNFHHIHKYERTTGAYMIKIEQDVRIIVKSKGLISAKYIEVGDLVYNGSTYTPVKVVNVLDNSSNKSIKSSYGFDIIVQSDQTVDVVDNRCVMSIGSSDSYTYDFNFKDTKHKNSNNKPNNCVTPTISNNNIAYFLGYFYGDGSVYKKTLSLACSNKDKLMKIQSDLINIVSDNFQYTPRTKNTTGEWNCINITNLHIIEFLRSNNLVKGKSHELIIPEHFLNISKEIFFSFYSGYFDADGYASGKKKGYCSASVDLDFTKTLQLFLLSNGVISKIHKEDRQSKNWRDLYTLCVIGKFAQTVLKNNVNIGTKIVNCDHISKRDGNVSNKTFSDIRTSLEQHNIKRPINVPTTGFISMAAMESIPKYIVDNDKFITKYEEQVVNEIKSIVELSCDSDFVWANGFMLINS